jgi:hypothetical protein
MINLDTYLETMLPDAQSLFPSQENIDRIRKIARLFPASLSRCIVLESRLKPVDRNTDFLLCITKAEREPFSKWLAANQFIFDQKSHDQVSKLIRLWSSAGSALSEKIEMIWLEFDITQKPQLSLIPGLFIGSREFPTHGQKSVLDASWALTEALPGLVGDGWTRYKPLVKRTIGCLPEDARLFQMGIFTGRENSPLRLCITRISPDQIIPYLTKIGYPSDCSILKEIIQDLAPLCELHLDIDVSSDLERKIGLECSLPFRKSAEFSPLLDFLVDRNWCSSESRTAILKFPGLAVLPDPPDAGPEGQTKGVSSSNSLSRNTFHRDLMHIKLVYRPDQQIETKVYLQGLQSTMSGLEYVKRNLYYQARQKLLPAYSSSGEPALENSR